MPVVGLTGGIASGKSTVAGVFESKGAVVLDADEVAREVTAPGGRAFEKIVDHFGPEVVSPEGGLDRHRLAQRVFADAQARETLEEITHPEIFRWLRQRKAEQPPGTFVVVEAALLVETLDSWTPDLEPDAVVVVLSRPDEQVARLTANRRVSESDAWARVQAQGSWDAKLTAADYVIYNSGSIEGLEREAARVWEQLRVRLGS